jgi:uncharacterized GH25 family protein
LLAGGAAAPVLGHDLFLRPERFPQPGDRQVTVRAVLGFSFPEGGIAPREHLKLMARTDDGRTVALETTLDGDTRRASTPLAGAGGHVVYADYPGYITRTEKGNEFLPKDQAAGKEIKSSVFVSQNGKLILRQGGSPSTAMQPVGLPLEIVPEVDPATLRAGDLMPVRVLWKGKPYGSAPGKPAEIKAVYAGFQEDEDTYAFLGRLDREGRARLKLTQAGTWMALVEFTIETPGSPKADRDMYISTLVFQVGSPGQKPQ